MKQPYFIVVVAHSLHCSLRRIHIPHTVIYAVLALALLGTFSVFGILTSYARMVWKVSNYNSLREEANLLRERYQNLLRAMDQTNDQLATLQLFATEVSASYGIRGNLATRNSLLLEDGDLLPSYPETLEEYNFLKSARFSQIFRRYPKMWLTNSTPSLWPADGSLVGHFGGRLDPLSGEGTFHAGVDISAPYGSRVRAAGDGIVVHAEWAGAYGRMVVIEHGSGVYTRYAHLARIDVIDGQEVRRGTPVGLLGGSGRVTGPHLHYEVRMGSNPVNPYKFLARSAVAREVRRDLPF